jgi:hypothetical protein
MAVDQLLQHLIHDPEIPAIIDLYALSDLTTKDV